MLSIVSRDYGKSSLSYSLDHLQLKALVALTIFFQSVVNFLNFYFYFSVK